MANLRASKKDIRKTRKRNEQNSQSRARLRTLDKKIRTLVAEGKTEDAATAFKSYTQFLARAGQKNLIHHRQADRRKSRMAALLNRQKKSA
ncbi:MAG TPA: 30S ribosomal protein S20 [Leptospiraceae bacterium]|nr:30S ribosomal protein S20 [Leptospirales bacterium]HMU82665.1 30S ribosomal protein S20 [Leptospiraceae bacterium]HMX55571.1 30S ribosomal protein S20 [Leptospiraceae bacterium]HMY46133.1 30S ribosomal protein S20 [Leptospiraceae bacterium]HMZ37179.1 30S ribosomal protein S20 [Leptospiraceae bacterium]